MINRISEIISPTIKARLLTLATQLVRNGFTVVQDLVVRLTIWLDGNDRGQFVLDHYTDIGFYYVILTNASLAEDGKITLSYTLKNLFTDVVTFNSFERFNRSGNIETQNYVNAGFSQFQIPTNIAGYSIGAFDPRLVGQNNYKIIMARSATQFTQTITPGSGGGGIVTSGGGFSTTGQPGGSSSSSSNSAPDFLSQYGIYIGLGLVALFLFNKKEN